MTASRPPATDANTITVITTPAAAIPATVTVAGSFAIIPSSTLPSNVRPFIESLAAPNPPK